MKLWSPLPALHDFFFAPVDARGVRLMRAGWGATVLVVMLPFFLRVPYLFAEPKTIGQTILVFPYAWSLLFWITTPAGVTALYALLLAACTLMIVGYRPRLATIVAVVLFASFAERNIEVFHTEATLLRLFGFILLLASFTPGYAASARWWSGAKHGSVSMVPAWVYRLLLWQIIVLYVATGWHKTISPFWTSGSAVVTILHLEYSRLSPVQADAFQSFSFFLSYATMLWEIAWCVLLLPLRWVRTWVKRVLMLIGVVMHVSWAVCLNHEILPLSLAMLTAYLGLLTADDWRLLPSSQKLFFFTRKSKRIAKQRRVVLRKKRTARSRRR